MKFFNETNINEMIENINQIKKQYSWLFLQKLLALTSSKEQYTIMKQDIIRNISDSISLSNNCYKMMTYCRYYQIGRFNCRSFHQWKQVTVLW